MTSTTQSDVVVYPGFPGHRERTEDGRGMYPGTTADIVKLLREAGLETAFAEPREMRVDYAMKADEIWLPVVAFTIDALASGAGSLFAHAVVSLLGARESETSVLHLRAGRADGDDITWFEANGSGNEVLDAFNQWADQDRD